MSHITSHILDTTKGKPAQGVHVILYQQQGVQWIEAGKGITDANGRINGLLKEDVLLPAGVYKLKFETKAYFDKYLILSFYPFIEIVFEIRTKEHYHVPLLLNPFGYSTYRGT